MALLLGLVAGAVVLLAATAPSLFQRAGRSPLRSLALVAAAGTAVSAGSLPQLQGVLDAQALRALLQDGAVVLVVSLLVVFELLLLVHARWLRRDPATAANGVAAGGIAGIRIALFLFMLAEELSRSFLPLYAQKLYTPIPGLSETLMMGLPIGLFMLLVAVFTPFAGAWADRFGSRRTLLFGTLPAAAGFVGTALAQSVAELLLWRGACALGYAVMFIGAQGFIARHARREERTRGMAQFVAAVVVAGLCGAPIGGILADHVGERATFAVSALLALAAALAAALLLPAERGERVERRRVRWRDHTALLANPRFAALLLFSSLPTKLMLTGYLFYLVPVTLHGLGETPAGIGRILMIYGLTIVVLGPWVSRAADRGGRNALFAGVGGLVGGAGMLVVLLAPGVPGVLAGVAALGVAHALNNATQLALVPDVCKAECARIGSTSVFAVYRLLERGGSVLGPLLAAALADRFGHQSALAALGILGALCGAAFCVVFVLSPSPADTDTRNTVADAAGGGAP
ncbi:putative MFS family arabinose efflux permease [Azospirillum agricola]|uniref:MFS transporter n=1 Tax=Azospirillum agricola TaxID=1720247 RepID=UPI001AEB00E6|nr:MFS transporter [Azospirillum agricola]MBP2229623.1 putative MFS family arabinose efflux permease [Azospirillum agricola]